jgi:hypothetical protein
MLQRLPPICVSRGSRSFQLLCSVCDMWCGSHCTKSEAQRDALHGVQQHQQRHVTPLCCTDALALPPPAAVVMAVVMPCGMRPGCRCASAAVAAAKAWRGLRRRLLCCRAQPLARAQACACRGWGVIERRGSRCCCSLPAP